MCIISTISSTSRHLNDMKVRAPSFLKHFVSILTSLTKSKTAPNKDKAGSAKTRLLVFSIMHDNKMLFASITRKFHNLLGHLEKESDDDDEESPMKAVAVYAAVNKMDLDVEEDHDDEHCDGDMQSSSEIDPVKDSGQEVVELEDEIDREADIFIRRFHREMKLQKMESFKRLQKMLQKSV